MKGGCAVKLTVLIAVPDAELREALVTLARESGCAVIEAHHAQGATGGAPSAPNAFLLAPLFDSRLDGLDLCRMLKGREVAPSVRIFLYGTFRRKERWEDTAAALGAEAVLDEGETAEDLWNRFVAHAEGLDGEEAPEPARYRPDQVAEQVTRLASDLHEVLQEEDFRDSCGDAVLQVAQATHSKASLEELASLVLNEAMNLTHSQSGWVMIREEPTSEDLFTLIRPETLDRNALVLALSLVQEPFLQEDYGPSEPVKTWQALGFERLIVQPLSQGVVGWIGVANSPGPYTPLHERLIQTFAVMLSLHHQQHQALHRAREAMDEAQALFNAATLILPYEEPEVVARQVAQTVASVLGYRESAVLFPSEDGDHLNLMGASGNLEKLKASLPIQGGGLTVKAYRTGRMVYTPDTHQSPDYEPGWEGCRTELCLPLIHRNQVLGVLDVESASPRAFQGKDLRVLEAFAQRISTLIYAAKQYRSLSETKDRYYKLCEGAPVGLFTWNMNTGRIEQASAVLSSWVGEEVEGKIVDTILTEDSRRSWRSWIEREPPPRMPLDTKVHIAAGADVPPVECSLMAFPGHGKFGIPGHGILLATVAGPSEEDQDAPAPQPPTHAPVLLCDPDPVWSSVARLMLEDWGYRVLVAEGMESVTALLDTEDMIPCLLMVDHVTATASSQRWLHAVRKRRPGLPVLVTGIPTGAVEEVEGMAILPKPYRMSELNRALETLLETAGNKG